MTRITATDLATPVLMVDRIEVALTADDQIVTTIGRGHIALSSDDAVAANRTFVLSAGVAGQRLLLEWVGANAGELIDDSANSDSGNVRLSGAGNWTPLEHDVLSLLFNGTDWLEVSRASTI
jgi:hypothetical protein